MHTYVLDLFFLIRGSRKRNSSTNTHSTLHLPRPINVVLLVCQHNRSRVKVPIHFFPYFIGSSFSFLPYKMNFVIIIILAVRVPLLGNV